MAWEIGISAEGWAELYEGCHKLSKKELVAALADDDFENAEHNEEVNIEATDEYYQARVKHYDALYQDMLADLAYERIEENNTCDNGGFRYWIDRQGYHAVTLK